MIYGLIFTHWLSDFVAQTDWMAKNKSKSNFALSVHIMSYSCGLLIFAITTNLIKRHMGLPTTIHVLTFVAINGLAHFAVDYVTSRISSKLWERGQVHNFFVVIGLDQAIHMATLVATFNWLLA